MQNLEVVGHLTNASNATLLVSDGENRYVYKPQSGERRLWDFPEGTLFKRERAAYVLSELLGWDLVPQTVIDQGPLGIGSFQNWIEAQVNQVDIFTPDEIPAHWLTITSGVDESGQRVTLAHSNSEDLQKISLLDALMNNADRKAGHLLTDATGKTWAIDHGVTFNVEAKLRTVLWGWLDQEIPANLLEQIALAKEQIRTSELKDLLAKDELDELLDRFKVIVETKVFPEPSPNWPAVPWPIF
jgi:uncharacterized repeat protein (TIGR03843 family)